MRVLLSGGGTAGHVMPILAVVSTLLANPPTGANGPSSELVSPEGVAATAAAVSRSTHAGGSLRPESPLRAGAGGARVGGQASPVELLYVGAAGGIEETLVAR